VHGIVVVEVDGFVGTTSVTHDTADGRSYVTLGGTTPSLGVFGWYGVVIPFKGNSASDVISGWSAGGSLSAKGISPAVGISINTSGVIIYGGGTIGTGGSSASLTFTKETRDFKTAVKIMVVPWWLYATGVLEE